MTALAPEVTPHPLLSEGVVAYLGLGTAPTPRRNATAVGILDPHGDLILATRAVISAILDFETDDYLDIDTIRAQVSDHARLVCPDLSARAVEAIAWNYTNGWR